MSRFTAQLLAGAPASDVVTAVRRVVAVQAQSPGPARLAVRARTSGASAADVDRAIAGRDLVCTWAMRGTLHLLAAADVRWVVGLLGPLNVAAGRRRREQLGLTDALCARALEALPGVLAGEALTRAEVVRRLGLDLTGQAPAHLLGYAAGSGVICRGPDEGTEPTYVLLDEWVPRAPAPADPAAELARRYAAGYGPADALDFAAWSGLPRATARAAFEGAAHEGDGPVPPVRLLGHWDPLLLGYASRDWVLDPAFGRRLQSGGGFVMPAVLLDGRVEGTWSLDRRTRRVEVDWFGRVRGDVDGEAADIARFLG